MAKNKAKSGQSLIKRFVGNKNTVTILGFAACVLTLIIGYNIRVKDAISPTSLPVARDTIPTRTFITDDMVGKINIASTYVNEASNVIKNYNDVVGMYVSYKTTIPKGSLFYKDQLIEASEMPDAAFANIEDGQTIYSLAVDKESTFANSIRAGDYIDIVMSARDYNNNNLVIYGTLIKSIRVLAVKDSRGNNIVKNTLAYGEPAELLFAVDDEMFDLLTETEWVKGEIKLSPVIFNKNYTAAAGETEVASEYLQQFIRDQVRDFS
ncbi:MAG: hypothetical protein J1F35_04605 [Erysipelotrichales bacterium]|nr:hypothetical protein [Erysipelotrichales bacterium]